MGRRGEGGGLADGAPIGVHPFWQLWHAVRTHLLQETIERTVSGLGHSK